MNELSLERKASRDNLKELFAFVEEALIRLDAPEENRGKMMMALDEIVANVVNYAYPEGQSGTVGLRLCRKDTTITAEVVDQGKAFDPTQHPEPDITLPIEQRPIGGLGIHLTRKMMNSMKYDRSEGKNRLVITTSWEKPNE
jgi:anti-sigma regulatory factor (Ser/Thr protein kinase)